MHTSPTKHLVAIDIGSNSLHLIIVREQNNQTKVIHKQKQSIKLAAGLNQDDMLNEHTIKRAMQCLASFFAAFKHLPNCQVAIVATYALRQAKNSQQFIEQAAHIIPYPIDIISGQREAQLIFLGVAHTKALTQSTLIIDIGGGSTEFIIGQQLTPDVVQSLNIGCVSFSDRFFPSGDITETAMQAALAAAKQTLLSLSEQYHRNSWQVTLGTSGSMKAITKMMLTCHDDKHITIDRLYHLQTQLLSWGHYQHIPLASISENRRPLLAAATAILIACFEILNIEKLKYNAAGVREGLLYQLRTGQ